MHNVAIASTSSSRACSMRLWCDLLWRARETRITRLQANLAVRKPQDNSCLRGFACGDDSLFETTKTTLRTIPILPCSCPLKKPLKMIALNSLSFSFKKSSQPLKTPQRENVGNMFGKSFLKGVLYNHNSRTVIVKLRTVHGIGCVPSSRCLPFLHKRNYFNKEAFS